MTTEGFLGDLSTRKVWQRVQVEVHERSLFSVRNALDRRTAPAITSLRSNQDKCRRKRPE
jgi:hypothetical protein